MNEIQAIIRQITASVTFLPLLQVCVAHGLSHSRSACMHTRIPCTSLTASS